MNAPPTTSLWTTTDSVNYMRESGRAEHPSHETVLAWLEQEFSGGEISMLDCGVMSGVTFDKLRSASFRTEYTGIDISPAIIEHCRSMYPDAVWDLMSVNDLTYPRDSFDVVYARHLLEHLPHYEAAVRELFRVARRYVVLCLWILPADPEVLMRRETGDGYIWLNRYSPERFEALLADLSQDVRTSDISCHERRNRLYVCRL